MSHPNPQTHLSGQPTPRQQQEAALFERMIGICDRQDALIRKQQEEIDRLRRQLENLPEKATTQQAPPPASPPPQTCLPEASPPEAEQRSTLTPPPIQPQPAAPPSTKQEPIVATHHNEQHTRLRPTQGSEPLPKPCLTDDLPLAGDLADAAREIRRKGEPQWAARSSSQPRHVEAPTGETFRPSAGRRNSSVTPAAGVSRSMRAKAQPHEDLRCRSNPGAVSSSGGEPAHRQGTAGGVSGSAARSCLISAAASSGTATCLLSSDTLSLRHQTAARGPMDQWVVTSFPSFRSGGKGLLGSEPAGRPRARPATDVCSN